MTASEPVYEHCLGCGEDVTPCQAPDRCRLLGWRHVQSGMHGCKVTPDGLGGGFASPGHDEPGWRPATDRGHPALSGWVRTDG